VIISDFGNPWKYGMGKSGKKDWGRIRQAFKDALPANPEFNRVDCLNLLMFLAHNPNEGLLIQDLELRLPDLGSRVESIVSKLVALGLVKTSLQQGTRLSRTATDLMSPPPAEEVEPI
jgi:hypothetical protein